MDDTLSILASLIWVLALGMWPVGFMFGMCSPCCEIPCDWYIEFDRCLRYEVVGSNPLRGGDCHFVARSYQNAVASGGLDGGRGLQIARVQSKIQASVRVNIPGGSQRTPVGQTRTQTFRFLRPNLLSGVSYDVIGPPWHLEVQITVLGVASNTDQAVQPSWETDAHGQPKLILAIQQGSLSITHIEPATLFPTGLQRWGGFDELGGYRIQDVLSATRVGTDNFSWSVRLTGGVDVLERGLAVSASSICGVTSDVAPGVFLDEQAVSQFLSGSGALQFGNRRVTALPANIACGMSRDLVGHGAAMGVYPEKIYFNSPTPLAEGVCGSNAIFSSEVPLSTRASLSPTHAECMSAWDDGSRQAVPSDFWSGDTLLWNLQQGPYRQEINTPDGTLSLTTTSRIMRRGFAAPSVCRQGLIYFSVTYNYGPACVPPEISADYDFTINYYKINNDGLRFGEPYPVTFSGRLTLQADTWSPGEPGIGDLTEDRIAYTGGFIVQPGLANSTPIGVSVIAFPELVLPCDWPSAASFAPPVFIPSAFQVPPSQSNFNTLERWAPVGDGSYPPGRQPTGTTQDEMYYALPLVGTCGPWSPVSADGGETTRTCVYSDTEVVEGEFTQTATLARSRSALPKVVIKTGSAQEFFFGMVTQAGRCELAGLRSVTDSVSPNNTFSLIQNPHLLKIAEAGACYSFDPVFSGERRTGSVDGDVLCFDDATTRGGVPACDGCVPSVVIESDGENADVRYNGAGERAGFIDVVPRRTWRGGEGVTFRVACGQDEFTQTVKRADTAPSPPTNLTVTRGPCGTATLSWEAPHDGGRPITQYTVWFRRIGSFSASSASATATSATITGLLRLGYEFFVTATNPVGVSQFSDMATDGFALAAPTGLAAATRDPCDRVSLSWAAPTQSECIVVAAYRVQVFTPSAGWQTFATIAGSETSATVTGLAPSEQYSFRIGRVDDANTVLFSNIITVPGCPPA